MHVSHRIEYMLAIKNKINLDDVTEVVAKKNGHGAFRIENDEYLDEKRAK